MSASRRDLLGECNIGQFPLDVFQSQCCSGCFNPECSRSLFGQSRFDLRVGQWEKALFTDVSRMSPDDPRYNSLAGKKFLTIDTGRTPEIRSDWVDPRDVSRETPPIQASPVPIQVSPPVESAPQVPEPLPIPAQQSTGVPTQLLLANTPASSGIMLASAPAKPLATPSRDPWATPEAPKDPVVPVGGRVKLGG